MPLAFSSAKESAPSWFISKVSFDKISFPLKSFHDVHGSVSDCILEDNKQVAVLVPTTVLAYQHFQTFSERLKDFPCKVDYLSRARSTKDVSRIVKELADGKINILIGTHKIIGKSVKFKDLGLLIIDEEQKFGVSVKEKLRQMKVNVDTWS